MSTPRKKPSKHRTARKRALVAALTASQKTLYGGLVMVERLKRQLERDWKKVVTADARYLAIVERTDPEYGGVGADDASFEDMPERVAESLSETLTEQIEAIEAMTEDIL